MGIDIPPETLAAAARARDGLTAGPRTDERGMAAVAKQAVFCEALLGAIRARFNELRQVAK